MSWKFSGNLALYFLFKEVTKSIQGDIVFKSKYLETSSIKTDGANGLKPSLYFIFKFYSMYRKISVDDNTKKLISTILKTRKVVKQYIAFNLTFFAVFFIVFGGYLFYESYLEGIAKNGVLHPEMPLNIAMISFIVLIIATAIFTFGFWLIYKLIYGILLKRLQNNFEELKKIDL